MPRRAYLQNMRAQLHRVPLLRDNHYWKNRKTQTYILMQQTIKQQPLDRDSWQVCDPDKLIDPLPMPYRLIDEVLSESIMKQVYLGVHEIEKKKKDPNYEGAVKEIQSQGVIELEGVSVMGRDERGLGYLVVGDRCGTIYLLDVGKKLVLSKKEVVTGVRVEGLACCTYLDGEVAITTIAVIMRGQPNIYIYRYRTGELKLFHSFTIIVSKVKPQNPNTDITSYPYQARFSKYGMNLAVALYDGSIQIYDIPEVTIARPKQQQQKPNQLQPQSPQASPQSHPTYFATLDEPTVTISEPQATIQFDGVPVETDYRSLLESLKKKQEKVVVEQPTTKKDPKKQPKKQQKKQQPTTTTTPSTSSQPSKLLNPKLLLGQPLTDSCKDYTPQHPHPKYKPFFHFLSETFTAPRSKYFEQLKSIRLSTRLMVCWKYTKTCNIYSVQELSKDNIPNYLYEQLYQEQKKNKRGKAVVRRVRELVNIYPVTCVAVSEDESLMACGLRDGTICLWDMPIQSIKTTLDKHKSELTFLSFFEIYRLFSGSSTGEVHLDQLPSGHSLMKRTNIFESKQPYSIVAMQVSMTGLGFVMDSLGGLRMYDLWRGEKIAKMLASTAYVGADGKSRRWWGGRPMLYCDEDTVAVVSEVVIVKDEAEMTAEERETVSRNSKYTWRKTTQLQIFRVFENLIGLFDGLANVYRRGIDRDKVTNLFSNLQMSQLTDKMFQIPKIGLAVGGNSTIPDDHRPPPPKSIHHKDSNSSSQRSQTISESSSSNTFKSKQRSIPTSPHDGQQQKSGLTKEALHPEMHLFKRRPTPKSVVVNEKWLIEGIRESHNKKEVREGALLREAMKGENGLQ